jgi:transcriptional regulator with XRE-family HTH domain
MRRKLTTMSSAQLRMARTALRWAITDLAVQANVSPTTIGRIEANLAAHRSTLDTLQKVFEQMGVVFVRHKDGDGIRLSHAGECVGDLLALADTALGPAATGPAIRARIDRYLRAARAWQKAWRVASRARR